ncbi:hypothetical protein [Desulfosporosinus sp. BG]|uniref:hypothetical protein n=1 Tax=Desulfosporosinus sp. BG TaxID=1633135 RepID=UPI00083A819B|nr:hypothetical protein [Desulfosporosinus sp. BG]ODA40822.1 hypothetical protein DSBG_2398 [Desulfosporosinus sp. BG]
MWKDELTITLDYINKNEVYVAKVDRDPNTAAFNYDRVEFKLTGELPEGWKISFTMKNQGQIFKRGKQVGSIEILGYYGDASGSGRPNHSSIVSVEGIKSGLGNGKLYILERDMPKDPRTLTEYYAIIPIKGHELAYNVWIDCDDLDNDLLAMKRFLQILEVNNGN